MGFSTGGGPNRTMSEINVTPFVDVMLVLLIVFMISAPLMQSGVDLDLPEANLEMKQNPESLVLSIDSQGKHYLNNDYYQVPVLLEKVREALAKTEDKTVYIRGDKNIPYGTVIGLIAQLKESGIDQVSLITLPPEGK
ncbi:MAG: ExbD/TolR family protein [Acidobacteria bacterium]|nr:ExbD/TolR family protein [Acidobacteriota bacterium]